MAPCAVPDIPLPGILGELAQAGHLGAALTLAREWGGTRRYIPADPRPGMELVALVGIEAAGVLAGLRGGEAVDVPRAVGLGSKKSAVLRATGSQRDIARAVGCTDRYVRKVRAACADDPDQGSLF